MLCPEIDELERHASGTLDEDTSRQIGIHLQACTSCRSLIVDISENLRDLLHVREVLRGEPSLAVPAVPEAIGPFRIVREIGRGGMGVVYLAEQEKPRREVALKVLRPGAASPEALRRFEHEADALGRLRHPGIAAIHAAGIAQIGTGGATESVPYFAMEYVRGERLDRCVRDQNLEPRARIALLARIADAVHHAHLNGIVHRDLKPGNILVESLGPKDGPGGAEGERVVKILDFGVARAAGPDGGETERTSTGQILGTVPYMSPEQLGGDPRAVDARSDVYALGVIGYEILVGELPHGVRGKPLAEAARIIRDEEPRRLGRFDRRFRGDLEVVLGRSLEKDPARRYQSASEFAADLRRYLGDQPVLARSPSAVYQLRKVVRRHRAPFALAVALFVLSVTFGVAMTILFGRARDAERRAKIKAETASQVAAFLAGIFEASDPRSTHGGDSLTARQVLDLGASRIDELRADPEVRAELLATLGGVYLSLGVLDRARVLFEEALSLRRAAVPQDPAGTASALRDLAAIEFHAGNSAAADRHYLEALEILRPHRNEKRDEFGRLLSAYGLSLTERGEYARAVALLREAVDWGVETHGERDLDVASAKTFLAGALARTSTYDEAETLLRDALAVRRELLGNDNPQVAENLSGLGMIALGRGDPKTAATRFGEALEIRRRRLGEEHTSVALGMSNLAEALSASGQREEAIEMHQQALAMRRKLLGDDHPQVSTSLNNLASVLRDVGRYDEAERHYHEALEIRRRVHGPEHPYVAATLGNLGRLKARRGDLGAAETFHQEALALRRKLLAANDPAIAMSLTDLGEVLLVRGRTDEARRSFQEALGINRRALGDRHPEVARALNLLGKLAKDAGSFAEAESLLMGGLEILRETSGAEHAKTAAAREELAQLYEAWGKPEKSAAVRAQAEPGATPKAMPVTMP